MRKHKAFVVCCFTVSTKLKPCLSRLSHSRRGSPDTLSHHCRCHRSCWMPRLHPFIMPSRVSFCFSRVCTSSFFFSFSSLFPFFFFFCSYMFIVFYFCKLNPKSNSIFPRLPLSLLFFSLPSTRCRCQL